MISKVARAAKLARLGAIAPRGERRVLIVDLDSLLRVSSNPFFPYLAQRIAEGIPSQAIPGNAAR